MPKEHGERRLEIITTARDLFVARGYDGCTVNDIIEAVGIAKGTFYHYFSGKEALLHALVEHLTGDIMARVNVIAEDRTRSALDRLTAYFRESVVVKAQNRETMLVVLYALYRPENTMLRIGILERSAQLIAPVLAHMIRDGVEEGEFRVDDPELCGEYIIRSFSTLSERAGKTILAAPDAPELLAEMHRIYDFMEWTLARLLDVERKRVVIADRAVADTLFGTATTDSPKEKEI
ncbi:MAG: TetR/AcrR family transcriptional regulator [Alkalispirochaeta sp.]